MEQTANTPLDVPANEPHLEPTPNHPLILAQESDQLTESLIDAAAASSGAAHADWRPRADGWTPDRIRTFLTVLADTGVVTDAARAAGMMPQSAYRFRNSPKGRAFDLAWSAALVRARRRIADLVVSRAINGCVDVIVRDGKIWSERHRFDNRLTMAVLTRLDALAKKKHEREEVVGALAQELDEYVDIVADGGDQAADFIRSRCGTSYLVVDEAQYLERINHYARTGTDPLSPPVEEGDDEGEADENQWQV